MPNNPFNKTIAEIILIGGVMGVGFALIHGAPYVAQLVVWAAKHF